MKIRNIIIRNTLVGWFERIVQILSVVVVTPILIYWLGKEEYGIWITIAQGAGLLMLFDFGVANSVSRFVSRSFALEDEEEISRIFCTSMAIFLGACLVSVGISAAIAGKIPAIFKIRYVYHRVSILLFLLTAFCFAGILPLRVGRGLLQAKNRYDIISLVSTGGNLCRIVFILIVFQAGLGNLLWLAVITVVLGLGSEVILFVLGMRGYQNIKVKLGNITARNFVELASLGGSALLQTISGMVYRRGQIIAVSVIMGVSITPLFAVPASLVLYLGPFINRLGATFTPLASHMDAKGDFEKLHELNIVGVRYGLLLSMPICIFLVFFGESMLKLWLGSSGLTGHDLHLMALMLTAIAIPFSLSAPQVASRSMLTATGRHWAVAYGFLISSLVGLLVSVIVMKWSKFGVLGAAIGLSSTYLFTGVALYPMLICRHLDIPGRVYFKEVYISPLVVGILLAACCFSLNVLVENTDIVMIVVKIALLLIIALLLTLYIGLYPQHRKDLFRGLKESLWAT